MPDFIEPQLCQNVERPPSEPGFGHEIKFDGYRVQMRVAGAEVTLKTRKGLDWSQKFPAIAKAGASLPDGSHGRYSRWMSYPEGKGYRYQVLKAETYNLDPTWVCFFRIPF